MRVHHYCEVERN